MIKTYCDGGSPSLPTLVCALLMCNFFSPSCLHPSFPQSISTRRCSTLSQRSLPASSIQFPCTKESFPTPLHGRTVGPSLLHPSPPSISLRSPCILITPLCRRLISAQPPSWAWLYPAHFPWQHAASPPSHRSSTRILPVHGLFPVQHLPKPRFFTRWASSCSPDAATHSCTKRGPPLLLTCFLTSP